MHRRVQNRLGGDDGARRRRAGERENADADHGADAERRQAPRAQRLAQPLLRLLGGRNQSVDALGAEELAQRPVRQSA